MPDFATLTSYVRAIFIALFPVTASEEWTAQAKTLEDGTVEGWTDEQRKDFNKFMHLLNDVYNDKLRRPYDRTIWNGHKSGKVVKSLEPVRAETVRKDSAKSEPVSADNIFDALVGIETVEESVTTE